MRSRSFAMVALITVVLGGCEGNGPGPTTRSAPVIPDLSVIDSMSGSTDCPVYRTPAALSKVVPVIFRGTVVDVEDGPILYRSSSGGEDRVRLNHMVLKIKVDRVVKGAAALGAEPYAYLAMGRGADVVDASGRLLGAEFNPTIGEAEKALPMGTEVIAFTGPYAWSAGANERFVRTGAGRPPGAPLLGGFFRCDGLVNFNPGKRAVRGWGELTYPELSAMLDRMSG